MADAERVLIKKYGNRRLYDTEESRYITLDELATKIAEGATVEVVDAKTKADLTGATLTQIINEGRGLARLLPVDLLHQLIRLGDDALAEFFGRWVVGALEVYLQAKRQIRGAASWNPFATVPMAAQDFVTRLWMSSPLANREPPVPPSAHEPATSAEVAALRREIADLKDAMRPSPGGGEPPLDAGAAPGPIGPDPESS